MTGAPTAVMDLMDTAVSGTCIEPATLLSSSPCATSVKGPVAGTVFCSRRSNRAEATGKRMDASTVAPLGATGGDEVDDGDTVGVRVGVIEREGVSDGEVLAVMLGV